jgi:hypothetical protein
MEKSRMSDNPDNPRHDPLLDLRLAHFADLVGATLSIDFGSGPTPAAIIEARSIGSPTPRPQGGFSVMLKADVGAHPAQGVFRLGHPQLGELDLFMVPRRRESADTVFEITVN